MSQPSRRLIVAVEITISPHRFTRNKTRELHPLPADSALRQNCPGFDHDLVRSTVRIVIHAINARPGSERSGLKPTRVSTKERHEVLCCQGLIPWDDRCTTIVAEAEVGATAYPRLGYMRKIGGGSEE